MPRRGPVNAGALAGQKRLGAVVSPAESGPHVSLSDSLLCVGLCSDRILARSTAGIVSVFPNSASAAPTGKRRLMTPGIAPLSVNRRCRATRFVRRRPRCHPFHRASAVCDDFRRGGTDHVLIDPRAAASGAACDARTSLPGNMRHCAATPWQDGRVTSSRASATAQGAKRHHADSAT